MKRTTPIIISVLLGLTLVAFAAYESDITSGRQLDIQSTMLTHVDDNTVHDTYFIYDAVANDMKRLQFRGLHGGIEINEGFYVSCSHFVDGIGRSYCVDLVVAEKDGEFRVIDSVLHKVDEQERDYNLMSSLWSPGYYYGLED